MSATPKADAPEGTSKSAGPWQQSTLAEWSIVGMNHYRMAGERRLFVAMTNAAGQCIQAEGVDDIYLWNRLCHKAWAVAAAARTAAPQPTKDGA